MDAVQCCAFHNFAPGNLLPGGYGLLLAREMVDELVYNEQGNEVILIKYIDPVMTGHPEP